MKASASASSPNRISSESTGVAAQGPEPAAKQIADVVLENQLVPFHAVQPQLALQHGAHLLGAAGKDEQLGISSGAQLANQRRGAGNRHFVARFLEGASHQLPKGIELALQVGLVQILAIDVLWRSGIDAVGQRHGRRPSAIARGSCAATALAATFPALAIARARDRPCALIKIRLNPRTGAPPYCCQSVTA